jgi:uncharacterized membrane protein YdjX (TVP38/TMEM64 family)
MTNAFIEWLIRDRVTLGPILTFAMLFVASGLLPIPRTFLCVLAGAMFGLSLEMMLVAIFATSLGSILAFVLARTLCAGPLQRELDRRPRLRLIADAIDTESWRLMALCRFGLPAPGFIQNYVFGLSRIRFWPYTLVSLIFTTPQTLVYLYIGAMGRSALLNDWSSPTRRIAAAIAVVCTLSIVFLISRRMRVLFKEREKKLAQA